VVSSMISEEISLGFWTLRQCLTAGTVGHTAVPLLHLLTTLRQDTSLHAACDSMNSVPDMYIKSRMNKQWISLVLNDSVLLHTSGLLPLHYYKLLVWNECEQAACVFSHWRLKTLRYQTLLSISKVTIVVGSLKIVQSWLQHLA